MSKSTGPVVVTGANSRTGREMLSRLAEQDADVVALVRRAQDLPVREVVDDWMRSQRAVDVLANASTVVHLCGVFAAGDWDSYEAGTVATTRRVLDSVNPAARLVYLSYVGADPAHDNWYVKAKGQAEELVRTVAGHVIFRIHAVVGGRQAPAPFELMFRQSAPGAPVRVVGDGTQRFRPTHSADILDALTQAALGRGEAGTYDLVGPSEFALADLPELINGHRVPIEHMPVQRPASVPGPPQTVVDLLAHPMTPGDPDAVTKVFDLSLTRPETNWPIVEPSDL
ncbi:NAD-dependent epimerase/dehydratase family protein [Streptomyces sp. NPDC051636]|uniref:NAD-dependent epimerase/dehydratase family protein n=1 Tax=Streptomyces sp. NPDC051636 TaxID=3365663 RepID=UPI0037B479BF